MKRSLTAFELKTLLDAQAAITLLDVRRPAARDETPFAIPGARWRDPETLEQWIDDVTPDRDVVLYCAHGQNISEMVVDAFHLRGRSARFLVGGFEAWQVAGGDVEAVPGAGSGAP